MSTDRYPSSTADGKDIPLEIVSPKSFLIKTFSSVVSGSLNVPSGTSIMSVLADAPCIIRFGANASLPADGTLLTDALFVPANMVIMISPVTTAFTIIRAGSVDGSLVAQFYNAWAGLSLATQTQRR